MAPAIGPTCNVTPPLGQECPSNQLNRSSFKGFNYGVHATGSGTINTVYIDNTDFEQNVRNVWIEKLDNFVTTRSNFLVGESVITNSPIIHEGLVSINSTGYRIEENNFSSSLAQVLFKYGTRVLESGTANNRIYKNYYTSLHTAELAEGLNRNPFNAYEGFQFLCNEHLTNIIDLRARKITAPNNSNHGIRDYQGEPNPQKSAGNLFSQTTWDFISNTDWPIIYYHTGSQTEPLVISGNIIPVLISNANSCPSNFDNDVKHPLDATTKMQLENDYDAYETAYINLLYNYNQLIDGGNTPALLLEIQLSWPADAWALRDELLSYSPYLSQDVLREAAMRDILPHAMLLEVCLANPEGTRGDDFIRFLQEEIPSPMPQYMIDLIIANWETETARTLLEGSLAHYTAKMAFNADVLLADLMLDTIGQQTEVNNWLARRGTLSDRYHLIESYTGSGNFTTAQSLLETIPEDYRLDDYLLTEYTNYLSYFNFRKDLNDSGKTIAQLENSEIDYLNNLAETSVGRPSVMASNILCFFYNICRDYSTDVPEGFEQRVKPNLNKINLSMMNKVELYPNPVGTYATITWDLPYLERIATLHIKDLTGRIQLTQEIRGKSGYKILDTRKVTNGFYLFEVIENDNLISSGKFVIQK